MPSQEHNEQADYRRVRTDHRQDVLTVSSDLRDAVLESGSSARVVRMTLRQELTKPTTAAVRFLAACSIPALAGAAVVVFQQVRLLARV